MGNLQYAIEVRHFEDISNSVNYVSGKMWRYVFLVVLFSQTLTALQIPKWSDVFSSLEPYKDPETLLLEEEDAGEARLGFVQVICNKKKRLKTKILQMG